MESPLKAWIRALERTASLGREPGHIFPVVIDSLAQQYGNSVALSSPIGALTYAELSATANRVARWGLSKGLRSGDVVCLLMPNRPEFIAIWTGLTRIGVTVALLNTQLMSSALAHCINIAKPRLLVVDPRLRGHLEGATPYLRVHADPWDFGPGPASGQRLDEALRALDSLPIGPDECAYPMPQDNALFIYTSGTTGLPKAAKVSHLRVMQWTHWFAGMINVTPNDRMYNCLPLYHSVGGIVAAGATLVGGGCVVIRERFSASGFWDDVVAERCTLFQYIGELCRYLLASPPQSAESLHSLRICVGNGLRSEVWEPFQKRFAIPQILEYYASTEGNFSLYNCEGRIGSIGKIPSFLGHRLPVAVVRFDVDNERPVRGADGSCIKCQPGDIGEALGLINNGKDSTAGRFEGYADADATSRKILHDVFDTGDSWYRTGDLMWQDADGFFYFADRVGDTFRWKGENVSTSEVSSTVQACAGVTDAVTYGVRVPGHDGRSGMTAISVNGDFDLSTFATDLDRQLPSYALPMFIRIVAAIDLTGTLKLNKQLLMQQAFDPSQHHDAVFYFDRPSRSYNAITPDMFKQLIAGTIKI